MGILGGRLVGLLLLIFLVIERFQLGASFISEGIHLLRFREGIEHDPYGALSNWGENGAIDYCSWFGVTCSDDFKVVALNLPDLSLNGIISPKIGKLNHLRIVDLSNNSFYGVIPREIGELKQLVVLDLRNNSLSGTLPSKVDNILSLKLLLINGNMISGELSPKLKELAVISEVIEQDDFEMSEKRYSKNGTIKRQLQSLTARKAAESANRDTSAADPSPSKKRDHTSLILGLAIGGVFIIGASLALYMFFFKGKKVNIVPWKTGLSGPISRALITGVPSLGRAELDAACENFSNIIATSPDHTIYKGTLSNGSEIAVVSTGMPADKWMDLSENQFKLKISTLSKINHKNFMNLLGFCNDDDPFTRMLVVEYAPNGTLFEHLHIKEAEQLDWSARLRIAMGIIYFLEYLESINPPARVKTLNSYTIYLSEDYAAKVSDIGFGVDTKKDPFVTDDPNGLDEEEPIVYKYAVLLLELISGKLPFSADTGLLVLWASSYLSGKRSLMEMVDPTLDDSISEEFLIALCEVIRSCINPNTEERPNVAQVAKQMKEVTRLSPEAVIPRDSPLWWAELEILSTEGS